MPTEVTFLGGDRLHAVARTCRDLADGKYMRTLGAGARAGAKDMRGEVLAHTREYMPAGYEQTFADAVEIKVRANFARDASVSLIGTAKGRGRARHVAQMEDGSLRHPVFGRTRRVKKHWKYGAFRIPNPWVRQHIRPHWFSEPALRALPKLRARLDKAAETAARKIERAGL